MNSEELALRAGFWCVTDKEGKSEWMCVEGCLERFAELVAAAEREACAKLCDDEARQSGSDHEAGGMYWCAEKIRGRQA